MNEEQIFELLLRRGQKVAPQMTIYNDTSALMDLDSGNFLLLDGKPYLLRRNEIESGFGMDGDPKYSVKKTINLKTGETHIIKNHGVGQ